MSANSVQLAHDDLLAAMPEGESHDCSLCHPGAGTAQKKEVAEVTENARTFTETEHFALLTDAVARETASLSSDKETLESSITTLTGEKAELAGRLDVLEAEKQAAEKSHSDAVAEFTDFKAELEQKAAVEARKTDRVAAVKAASADLDDTYFTDERTQRWAEMADDAFTALISDLAEAAAKKKPAFLMTDDEKKAAKDDMADKARETAAFTGGTSPTDSGSGSLFGRFMSATGKLPAAEH